MELRCQISAQELHDRTVWSDKFRATLRGGKIRFVLPAFKAPGKVRVVVTYVGGRHTFSAARTIRITMLRA